MNARTARLRSYLSLLRMASVRESMAAAELAKASHEASERRDVHRQAVEQSDALMRASRAMQVAGGQLDLAKMQWLSMLDVALSERQAATEQALIDAELQRDRRAQDNWRAKRYRERVDAHCQATRAAMHHERAAKLGEEAIELWIDHRGDAS